MREKENLLSEIVVLQGGQIKLALEHRDALVVSRAEHRVDIGDESGRICTTVLRHALLNRLEVFPDDCQRLGLDYAMECGRTHQKSPSAWTGALDAHAAAKSSGYCSWI